MDATPALPRPALGRSLHTRRLSPAECRRRLADHSVARLGFDTGRGHRSVVVGYDTTVEGGADEVLLLLPEHHPATGYVVGATVTLEIESGTDEPGGGWESVTATGVAYLADAGPTILSPYGAGWPGGLATHEVHVALAHLEGTVDEA